jgi:hypothetical protein
MAGWWGAEDDLAPEKCGAAGVSSKCRLPEPNLLLLVINFSFTMALPMCLTTQHNPTREPLMYSSYVYS